MSALPLGSAARRKRGRRRPRWLVPALSLLALFALLEAIGALLPAPSGPRSSTYATATDGAAAYAELLQRAGHPVTRLRGRLEATPLDPRTTVVVLDPDVIVAPEATALKRFVTAGARLVIGARRPGAWLREIVGRPPRWSDGGPRTATPAPGTSPELPGVETVRSAGDGSWLDPGPARPLLEGSGGTLAVTRAVGAGELLLLADPSPLQNRLLDKADDASLGAALAGDQGRPVAFLESVHGYGRGRGLGALPDRWRWALAGLVLAALLWLAAHVRRLGPPELEGRELPPARRAYIDAIATLLARTGDLPRASAAVTVAARERLLRRSALPADASDEAVALAARRLGLEPDEAEALHGTPTNEEEARAAGRALALLERGRP